MCYPWNFNKLSTNNSPPHDLSGKASSFFEQNRELSGLLAQEDLTGVINGKNSLTFRTAETAGFQRFEFLGTDGAGKYFWENRHRFSRGTTPEEIYGIIQIIFNIKKLGKTK